MQSNREDKSDVNIVDRIFHEIGEIGLYQILNGILTCIAIAISACALFNFAFSSAIPNHRCLIPECETPTNATFNAPWVSYAIPEKCYRYNHVKAQANNQICTKAWFNQTDVIKCEEFLMENNVDNLALGLNILCTDKQKLLAYIGTANTIGRTIIMPIVGIISDRFGRLTTIIGSSIIGGIVGVAQVYSISIEMYLVLELLIAMANAGIISTSFIFNAEWTTSAHRTKLVSIIGTGNAFGGAAIGLLAWCFQTDFTTFKLTMSVPSFIIVFYYFILEESPLWLLAKRKNKRAVRSISRAATMNRRHLTKDTVHAINTTELPTKDEIVCDKETTFWNAIRLKILFWRFLVLSLVWIFALFAYYCVILGSTNIQTNKYLSFVIVALAEIPGALFALVIMDRGGRRITVGGTLFVCGISILASSFMPRESFIPKLILFVIGKAALTTTFLSLYTYTAELWPTTIRNTTVNVCSMLGRFGAIFASFTVLDSFIHLQSILCSILSIIAAALVFLFLPETSNLKKLPDSLDDAVAIGKKTAII